MLKLGLEYVNITPEENVPLIGYGDRTHDSTGIHDPLFAYILYIESKVGIPFIWVIVDLCLFSVASVQTFVKKLSELTDIDKNRIYIQTTHTHSGPDTHNISNNSAPWAVRYNELLTKKIAEGIKTAKFNSFTGSIDVRHGNCTLGCNRRGKEESVDSRVVLFSLIDSDDKERGLLFHYSCHLTVLGVENYLISSDWIGPARDILQKHTAVPVCFIQGAEGNIDPVFRGVLDMADPNQANGSSFAVVEKAGIMMAEAVMEARKSPVINKLDDISGKTTKMELPLRYGALTQNQVEEKLNEWKRMFANFLDIPFEDVTEGSVINALIKERCRKLNLSPNETRKIVGEQFTYIQFIWAYKFGSEFIDQEKGTISCNITKLDFGRLIILGIPAEVLIEIALEWQNNNPEKTALISSLFNGTLGYMPHKLNFEEINADSLYETISTIFGEKTSEIILNSF